MGDTSQKRIALRGGDMKLESFCKDAGDLYRIAVMMGGFDAGELMLEINRVQKSRQHQIAIPTIEKALQNIREKYLTASQKSQRQKAYNGLQAE